MMDTLTFNSRLLAMYLRVTAHAYLDVIRGAAATPVEGLLERAKQLDQQGPQLATAAGYVTAGAPVREMAQAYDGGSDFVAIFKTEPLFGFFDPDLREEYLAGVERIAQRPIGEIVVGLLDLAYEILDQRLDDVAGDEAAVLHAASQSPFVIETRPELAQLIEDAAVGCAQLMLTQELIAGAADNERRCPSCSCSESDACMTTDGACSWVEGSTECSACVDPSIRVRGPLAGGRQGERRTQYPPKAAVHLGAVIPIEQRLTDRREAGVVFARQETTDFFPCPHAHREIKERGGTSVYDCLDCGKPLVYADGLWLTAAESLSV